jgi:hypothetical protein
MTRYRRRPEIKAVQWLGEMGPIEEFLKNLPEEGWKIDNRLRDLSDGEIFVCCHHSGVRIPMNWWLVSGGSHYVLEGVADAAFRASYEVIPA